MTTEPIPFPGVPGERKVVTQSVAEHEVFLVFNSDEDAASFLSWLNGPGWPAFNEWIDLVPEEPGDGTTTREDVNRHGY